MKFLFVSFMVMCFHCSNAQYFDTAHIYYPTGNYRLDESHKQLLDSLARISDLKKVMIYAYADKAGGEKNNHDLSVKRAEQVKEYLVAHNMPLKQIPICEGMGEEWSEGRDKNNKKSRRTDIFLLRANKQIVIDKFNNHKIDSSKEVTVLAKAFNTNDIKRIEVDQLLRLNNIIFYPGSAKVLPSSENELRLLLQAIRDNPKLAIRLEGHVCCSIAPDGYEKDSPSWVLSEQRAQTVLKYLIDNDVEKERLSYKGFGRTMPVFKAEQTPEEQSANRRVEVRIIRK